MGLEERLWTGRLCRRCQNLSRLLSGHPRFGECLVFPDSLPPRLSKFYRMGRCPYSLDYTTLGFLPTWLPLMLGPQ